MPDGVREKYSQTKVRQTGISDLLPPLFFSQPMLRWFSFGLQIMKSKFNLPASNSQTTFSKLSHGLVWNLRDITLYRTHNSVSNLSGSSGPHTVILSGCWEQFSSQVLGTFPEVLENRPVQMSWDLTVKTLHVFTSLSVYTYLSSKSIYCQPSNFK